MPIKVLKKSDGLWLHFYTSDKSALLNVNAIVKGKGNIIGGSIIAACEECAEEHQNTKPPLGVVPKCIWHDRRILDLSRAIYEYVSSGRFKEAAAWITELSELFNMRETRR